jgi:hypothetical protein
MLICLVLRCSPKKTLSSTSIYSEDTEDKPNTGYTRRLCRLSVRAKGCGFAPFEVRVCCQRQHWPDMVATLQSPLECFSWLCLGILLICTRCSTAKTIIPNHTLSCSGYLSECWTVCCPFSSRHVVRIALITSPLWQFWLLLSPTKLWKLGRCAFTQNTPLLCSVDCFPRSAKFRWYILCDRGILLGPV